jgi:hypothetical protein
MYMIIFVHYKNLDLKNPYPVPALLSSGLDPVDLWCGYCRNLVDDVCRTPSYDESVTSAGKNLRGVLVYFSLWHCCYYKISQTGQLTKNARLLLLYLEAKVFKKPGVQEQGNGQCVVWSGSVPVSNIVWLPHPAFTEEMLTGFFSCRIVTRDLITLWSLDRGTLIPSMWPHVSWTNFLQEAPYLNVITSAVKFQHMDGEGAMYLSHTFLHTNHVHLEY